MKTIRQNVTIPKDRHLHVDMDVPEDVPEGEAELLIVISPNGARKQDASLDRFWGSIRLREDPAAYQRRIRDEWQ